MLRQFATVCVARAILPLCVAWGANSCAMSPLHLFPHVKVCVNTLAIIEWLNQVVNHCIFKFSCVRFRLRSELSQWWTTLPDYLQKYEIILHRAGYDTLDKVCLYAYVYVCMYVPVWLLDVVKVLTLPLQQILHHLRDPMELRATLLRLGMCKHACLCEYAYVFVRECMSVCVCFLCMCMYDVHVCIHVCMLSYYYIWEMEGKQLDLLLFVSVVQVFMQSFIVLN